MDPRSAPRRRRRGLPLPPNGRGPAARPGPKQPPFIAIMLLLLVAGFLLREQPAKVQPRPEPPAISPLLPQAEAQLRELLPQGSRITQALPLEDGSVALAWVVNDSARTGVAQALPGGRHKLWTAATEQKADVAGESKIALIRLPGLPEEVLVSTYQTEGCCSWVNLFALSDPPRVLFGSPSTSSKLLAGHIVVQKRPLGEYPPDTPQETEVYAWNGTAFAISGMTLAPSRYFPLAAGMRWRYQSGRQVVERWVHQQRSGPDGAQFVVRALARTEGNVQALPEAVYQYDREGDVRELSPSPRVILPRSPGAGSAWLMADEAPAEVVDIRPSLTVPAGRFEQVLVVKQGERQFYYAPHVGLIREEQGGKVLSELLSVNRPAPRP